MPVYHAFTSPVADATGTLTIWNGATTATVAASNIVHPSDWNSTHVGGIDLGASNTTYTSGTVLLSGGANITVGTNGQTITFSAASQSVQVETQTFLGGIRNSETTYTSGTVNLLVVGGLLTIRSTTGQAFQFSVSQSVQAETQTAISGIANSQTTYTSGTVSFSELGAITIRSTTGNQYQFSVAAQTAQTGISGIAMNAATTYTSGTVVLSAGANITLGSNAQTITISGVAAQTVQTQNMVAVAANALTTYTSGTVVFSATGGLQLSTNAQTISLGVPVMGQWIANSAALASSTFGNMVNTSVSLMRFEVPHQLSFTRVNIPVSVSLGTAATTATAAVDMSFVGVIYSRNASTLNAIVGQSSTTTYTWASNTGVWSSLNGLRVMSFNLATMLTPGEYYLGFQMSSHSGSSIGLSTTILSATFAPIFGTIQSTIAPFADMSAATGSTINALQPMQGVNSVSISATSQTHQASQVTVGTAGISANFIAAFRSA